MDFLFFDIKNHPAPALESGRIMMHGDRGERFIRVSGDVIAKFLSRRYLYLYMRSDHYPLLRRVIKEYSRILKLPQHEFKCVGNNFYYDDKLVVKNGRWTSFPFFEYSRPNVDMRLAEHTRGLSPRENKKIDHLFLDDNDPEFVFFIPKSKLKFVEDMSALSIAPNDQRCEKFFQRGKMGKALNAVYYTNENIRNQIRREFAIPELKFTLEPPEMIGEIYSDGNLKEGHTMGKSCMQGCPKEWFKIYEDHCLGILIARNQFGDFCGRALVWEPKLVWKDERVTLMDRVYASNYKFEPSFFEYAKKQGWWRKAYQDYETPDVFVDPEGQQTNCMMYVPLLKSYSSWPYADTFFGVTADRLLNSEVDENMRSTGGCLEGPEDENGETCWSEWHQEYIPEDEVVWSERLDDNLWRHHAVQMSNGDFMPEDSDEIVLCANGVWEDYDECRNVNGAWYHEDDLIYDDLNDEYIHKMDAAETREGHMTHKENCVVSYQGEWIHEDHYVTLADGRIAHIDDTTETEDGYILNI